jgi:hypothetical protein
MADTKLAFHLLKQGDLANYVTPLERKIPVKIVSVFTEPYTGQVKIKAVTTVARPEFARGEEIVEPAIFFESRNYSTRTPHPHRYLLGASGPVVTAGGRLV